MPKFVFIRNIRRTSLKKLSQTCLLEHNLSLLAPGPIRWKFCTPSKNAHKEIHVLLTSTKIIPGACERDFRILCVVIQCACMCGRGVGSKIAKTNIHLKYPVVTKKKTFWSPLLRFLSHEKVGTSLINWSFLNFQMPHCSTSYHIIQRLMTLRAIRYYTRHVRGATYASFCHSVYREQRSIRLRVLYLYFMYIPPSSLKCA